MYGELCRAETIVALLGRMPICVPALLHEYQREINPANGYYRARPVAGQQIVGLLFSEIAAAELERLDEFEDVANGLYQRVKCRVQLLSVAHNRVTTRAYIYTDPAG